MGAVIRLNVYVKPPCRKVANKGMVRLAKPIADGFSIISLMSAEKSFLYSELEPDRILPATQDGKESCLYPAGYMVPGFSQAHTSCDKQRLFRKRAGRFFVYNRLEYDRCTSCGVLRRPMGNRRYPQAARTSEQLSRLFLMFNRAQRETKSSTPTGAGQPSNEGD